MSPGSRSGGVRPATSGSGGADGRATSPLRRPVVAALAALAAASVCGWLLADEAPAQAGRGAEPDPGELLSWRFPVGERLAYAVTFGRIRVGEGALSVTGIDTVRGTPAYRLEFSLSGGVPFYRLDDRQLSWVAPAPLRSLRFEQHLREGDYRRDRRYELYQELPAYTRLDWVDSVDGYRPHEEEREVPMAEGALDEVAYLYLARLLPLEVGRTYRFERYFEESGNPVVLHVLRRETVRVPAGRFETVVVRPVIQTDGLFSEGGRAEVYISDDERRLIVQLKSHMKIGQLNMYLREHLPGRSGSLISPALESATSGVTPATWRARSGAAPGGDGAASVLGPAEGVVPAREPGRAGEAPEGPRG